MVNQRGSVGQLQTSVVAKRTVVLLNLERYLNSTGNSFVNLQLPGLSCMSFVLNSEVGFQYERWGNIARHDLTRKCTIIEY